LNFHGNKDLWLGTNVGYQPAADNPGKQVKWGTGFQVDGVRGGNVFVLRFYLLRHFYISSLTMGALSDTTINGSIRKEPDKYGYKLISVKSTKQKFNPIKKRPSPSWRKYVILDYSSAEATFYKEVA
jgi:hypothetical protein